MLDKLYITPRQWLRILRWVLYALLFFFAVLMQTVVLGNRLIFGARADFVPVVIACVCLREGPERGGLFALLASVGWYLTGADQGSVSIAVMTLVPVLGCVICAEWVNQRFLPCLLVAFLTFFLRQNAMFLLKHFFAGLPGALYLPRVLPCVAVSTAVQPLVYWLVHLISKIGDAYESA